MQRSIVHIATAMTLAVPAALASAHPVREGLGPGEPISELIVRGDCRAVLVGDSIASRNTDTDRQSSLFWGIVRTWQPDRFVGLSVPTNNNFPDVQVLPPSSAAVDATVRTLTAGGATRTFSNGYTNVAGAPAMDLRWSGDTPDGTPLVTNRLQLGGAWAAGDWFVNHQLDARFIMVATPETVPALRAESRRGSDAFRAGPTIDASGPRGIAAIDAPLLAASPDVPSVRLTAAGIHDESLAQDHLIWLTTRITVAGATGFSLDSLAVGGARIRDWQADGPFIDDGLLTQYLSLAGAPNLFIVQLGANDSTFDAGWAHDMRALINRLDAASAEPPAFLLVATYGTNFSIKHADALVAGDQLHSIATDGTGVVPGDRIAFFSYPAMLAGPASQLVLFDTIHPDPAGADTLASLMWQAITLPAACRVDLSSATLPGSPDGVLTGADFFGFLDAFLARAPAADLSSPGVVGKPDSLFTGADFFRYLQLFSQGCD